MLNSASPHRLALSLLWRQKSQLAIAGFWRALFVLVPMQAPHLTAAIVDGLTGKEVALYGWSMSGASAGAALNAAAIGLLIVALTYGLAAQMQMVSAGWLSRKFVFELRRRLAAKIVHLSVDQHQQFGAGDLIDRTISDTAETRRFVERVFVQTLTNVLRVGYPIMLMFWIDPLLALAALSILPPQMLISRWLQRRLHGATRASRRSQADLTTLAKETFDGIESIKTLHAEDAAAERMQSGARKLEGDELKAHTITGMINGNVWLLTSIGIALTWWLGGWRVLQGDMTLGRLIEFTGYIAFAYLPFRQFTTIASTFRQGLVSLERINELLELKPTIDENADALALPDGPGEIAFEDVSFAYADQRVVDSVSLAIPARRMVAVVGRSGSGKSSLLRLIARLYDPDAGRVLIDGQDVRAAQLASVRQAIAVVPQRPLLFTGSILENIRLGCPSASRKEVVAAAKAAGAHDFVSRLTRGYKTKVGRGGASLSGGEMQRIAIARAVVSGARILLLDEPTSALDAEVEAVVVDTLQRLSQRMTVVVVGHKLQTVCRADVIVVMDQGRVVAQGRHAALLRTCPVYQEMFAGDDANGRQSATRRAA